MIDLIQLNNVSVVYDGKIILEHIALNLKPEQVMTIIGPNGGGKTTLVKVMLGLIKPSTGQVIHKKALRMGYVPQFLQKKYPFPLTVERFMALSNRSFGDFVDWLDIQHLMPLRLHQLSGGELQKVMIAYAFAQRPDVLVLDEPVQGIDWVGQNHLYHVLERYRQIHPCAMLMVSHDLHFVMRSTAHVLCINQHICCQGTPQDIGDHPEFVAMFDYHPHMAVYTHHHDHEHH